MPLSNADIISQTLSIGLDVSYKDLISIRNQLDGTYVVVYEVYFNPHTDPKQLMDQKKFDTTEEVVTFFLDYINNLDFS